MIITCYCNSSFQDNLYGSKRRVMNSLGEDSTKFRCTVCGQETEKKAKEKYQPVEEKKKKKVKKK